MTRRRDPRAPREAGRLRQVSPDHPQREDIDGWAKLESKPCSFPVKGTLEVLN